MYIEYKGEGIVGPAKIGRVTYSKTGSSIHYGNRRLRRCAVTVSRPTSSTLKLANTIGFLAARKMGATHSILRGLKSDDDVRAELLDHNSKATGAKSHGVVSLPGQNTPNLARYTCQRTETNR